MALSADASCFSSDLIATGVLENDFDFGFTAFYEVDRGKRILDLAKVALDLLQFAKSQSLRLSGFLARMNDIVLDGNICTRENLR